MRSEFLETGEIVNTHGIQGEVKLLPWSDSPAFLLDFKTLYVNGQAQAVEAARVHKTTLLVRFAGVDSVEAAMKLKGKRVSIARKDAKLPKGSFFLADLIGLTVKDEEGSVIGMVKEVLTPSAQRVYVVETPAGEKLIPAVPEFIKKVDIEGGEMTVSLIEGM